MDASVHDTRLTDQQRAALATRRVSVALAAGAGCGKTFVLTERFLSHLDPGPEGDSGVDLSQIVAITFTERAAREMRGRIRTAVHQRLASAGGDAGAHWLRIVRRLDSARISTIHAFCAALLRSQAIEARLDPRFGVLEEQQATALLAAVADDVLRDLLARRDESLLDVLVAVDLRQLRDQLSIFIKNRHRFSLASWLEVTPAEQVARWRELHASVVVPNLVEQFIAGPALRRLNDSLVAASPPAGKMTERFAALRRVIDELPTAEHPGELLAELREHAGVKGVAGKLWSDPDEYEEFKNAAESARKAIDGLKAKLAWDDAGTLEAAQLGLSSLRVAVPVLEAYEQRKRELGCLDFDDLLIRARDLLCGPDGENVRRRAADQIKVLLVDEFQDTDRVQVELVEALCGDRLERGKLFFVGDHKQSIYRFRGAEPNVFHELRAKLPEAGRLPLSRNFRSQPAILDFVNGLFQDRFAEYEPLVAAREQVAAVPVVEFLWATDGAAVAGGEDEDGETPDAPSGASVRDESAALARRRVEADWIARRLRNMIDAREPLVWQPPTDGSPSATARPARPGDVALLFRAMSNVEVYEDALRRWGFDYYLVGGRAFYAQQEIYDLLNLLKALASPADLLSLAGALRSPIFGLTDETLFWLSRPDAGLGAGWRAAIEGRLPPQLEAQQAQQLRHAAGTVRELRAVADRQSVAELIQNALALTGYDAVLLAEFLGERKLANLHKLIAQAREFDRAGAFTLSDFIRQLNDQVVREPHEALAATHPESTDVVRLMTIHQSKGLEFPIVVLPDLERQPRGQHAAAACDARLGPLVKPPGSECKSTGLDLYQSLENAAEIAERTRLLYVATTRAADYLILSCGVEKLDVAKSRTWRELLGQAYDIVDGRYLGKPVRVGREPLVRVTNQRPEVASRPAGQGDSIQLKATIEEVRALAETHRGFIPAGVRPVPPDLKARRVFSFSTLSGVLQVDEPLNEGDADDPAPSPSPREETSTGDGTEFGTLIHEALSRWCDAPVDREEEYRAIVDHVAWRRPDIDSDQVNRATALLARFAASPRAAAIRAAATRYAELEFLLSWPSGPGEPLLIRGFIDCMYCDANGAWHIVDYKSHALDSETDAARAAGGYRLQMLTYAMAVEQSLGICPHECVLHFLRPGKEHALRLDDESRAWAGGEIDRRIAALLQGADSESSLLQWRV